MGFEAGIKAEEEKKKKEKSEKQKKAEMQKIIEQEKKKKEAREKNDKSKDKEILNKLENMLEEWNLSDDDLSKIKDIVKNVDISDDEIEEILEKIDEIEQTEDIDKYLPQEFRVSSEDYKQSITDDIKRLQTLTKLNTGLTILSEQINPDSSMWMNLFSGYMVLLDKKLITIQENNIDVKNSLQKVENKKFPPKKLTFWESIIDFFK